MQIHHDERSTECEKKLFINIPNDITTDLYLTTLSCHLHAFPCQTYTRYTKPMPTGAYIRSTTLGAILKF